MTTTIDLFCKDLLLKSRVKEIAQQHKVEVRVLRSAADYDAKQLTPAELLVVNANEFQDELPALRQRTTSHISCFVAHVDEEIIAKAKAAGVDDITPRSAFFNALARRFAASVATPN